MRFHAADGPTPQADGLNGATAWGIKNSRRSPPPPDVAADACRRLAVRGRGWRHDPPSVSNFQGRINDSGMTVPTDPVITGARIRVVNKPVDKGATC
jgi:hypothetical protein